MIGKRQKRFFLFGSSCLFACFLLLANLLQAQTAPITVDSTSGGTGAGTFNDAFTAINAQSGGGTIQMNITWGSSVVEALQWPTVTQNLTLLGSPVPYPYNLITNRYIIETAGDNFNGNSYLSFGNLTMGPNAVLLFSNIDPINNGFPESVTSDSASLTVTSLTLDSGGGFGIGYNPGAVGLPGTTGAYGGDGYLIVGSVTLLGSGSSLEDEAGNGGAGGTSGGSGGNGGSAYVSIGNIVSNAGGAVTFLGGNGGVGAAGPGLDAGGNGGLASVTLNSWTGTNATFIAASGDGGDGGAGPTGNSPTGTNGNAGGAGTAGGNGGNAGSVTVAVSGSITATGTGGLFKAAGGAGGNGGAGGGGGNGDSGNNGADASATNTTAGAGSPGGNGGTGGPGGNGGAGGNALLTDPTVNVSSTNFLFETLGGNGGNGGVGGQGGSGGLAGNGGQSWGDYNGGPGGTGGNGVLGGLGGYGGEGGNASVSLGSLLMAGSGDEFLVQGGNGGSAAQSGNGGNAASGGNGPSAGAGNIADGGFSGNAGTAGNGNNAQDGGNGGTAGVTIAAITLGTAGVTTPTQMNIIGGNGGAAGNGGNSGDASGASGGYAGANADTTDSGFTGGTGGNSGSGGNGAGSGSFERGGDALLVSNSVTFFSGAQLTLLGGTAGAGGNGGNSGTAGTGGQGGALIGGCAGCNTGTGGNGGTAGNGGSGGTGGDGGNTYASLGGLWTSSGVTINITAGAGGVGGNGGSGGYGGTGGAAGGMGSATDSQGGQGASGNSGGSGNLGGEGGLGGSAAATLGSLAMGTSDSFLVQGGAGGNGGNGGAGGSGGAGGHGGDTSSLGTYGGGAGSGGDGGPGAGGGDGGNAGSATLLAAGAVTLSQGDNLKVVGGNGGKGGNGGNGGNAGNGNDGGYGSIDLAGSGGKGGNGGFAGAGGAGGNGGNAVVTMGSLVLLDGGVTVTLQGGTGGDGGAGGVAGNAGNAGNPGGGGIGNNGANGGSGVSPGIGIPAGYGGFGGFGGEGGSAALTVGSLDLGMNNVLNILGGNGGGGQNGNSGTAATGGSNATENCCVGSLGGNAGDGGWGGYGGVPVTFLSGGQTITEIVSGGDASMMVSGTANLSSGAFVQVAGGAGVTGGAGGSGGVGGAGGNGGSGGNGGAGGDGGFGGSGGNGGNAWVSMGALQASTGVTFDVLGGTGGEGGASGSGGPGGSSGAAVTSGSGAQWVNLGLNLMTLALGATNPANAELAFANKMLGYELKAAGNASKLLSLGPNNSSNPDIPTNGPGGPWGGGGFGGHGGNATFISSLVNMDSAAGTALNNDLLLVRAGNGFIGGYGGGPGVTVINGTTYVGLSGPGGNGGNGGLAWVSIGSLNLGAGSAASIIGGSGGDGGAGFYLASKGTTVGAGGQGGTGGDADYMGDSVGLTAAGMFVTAGRGGTGGTGGNGNSGGNAFVSIGALSASSGSTIQIFGGAGGDDNTVGSGGAGGSAGSAFGNATLSSSLLQLIGGAGGSAVSNSGGFNGAAGGGVGVTVLQTLSLTNSSLVLHGGLGGNAFQYNDGLGGAGGDVGLAAATLNLYSGSISLLAGNGNASGGQQTGATGGEATLAAASAYLNGAVFLQGGTAGDGGSGLTNPTTPGGNGGVGGGAFVTFGILDMGSNGFLVAQGGAAGLGEAGGVNGAAGGATILLGALNGSGTVTMSGNGLTLEADSGDFGGVIAGAEGLEVNDGALTLAGDNSYTGGTTLLNGLLMVGDGTISNAGIEGNLPLSAGATLMGFGKVSGAVTNGGWVQPGGGAPGTLTVGSYTQLAGGTLDIGVTPNGAGDLNVLTSAQLGGALTVVGSGNFGIRYTYIILDSGNALATTFTSTGYNLSSGMAATLSYGQDAVTLTLYRPGADFTSFAQTPNQAGVAGVLNQSLNGLAGGALSGITNEIYSLSSGQGQVLNELQGQVYTALPQVMLGNLQFEGSLLFSRLNGAGEWQTNPAQAALVGTLLSADMNQSLASGEAAPLAAVKTRGFWIQNTDNFGAVAGNSNVTGFNQSDYGFLGGYDTELLPGLTGGLMGGYTHTTVTAQDGSGQAGVDGVQLGAYGSQKLEKFDLGLVAGFGTSHFNTNRTITIGSDVNPVQGTTDGSQVMAALQGDYRMEISGVSVKPLAGIQYAHFAENAFTETGSNALALSLPSQSYDSMRPYIGVNGAKTYGLGGDLKLTPMVNLSVGEELMNNAGQFQAALGGAPGNNFTVTGVTPSATLFGVGAGFDLAFGAPFNLFASYNGSFSGTETLNTFNGGLSLSY